MAYPILYPDEGSEQVHRHSSIDQFRGFLSVMKKGGWAPIVFDQLDGINCEDIVSHPVIISFSLVRVSATYSNLISSDNIG